MDTFTKYGLYLAGGLIVVNVGLHGLLYHQRSDYLETVKEDKGIEAAISESYRRFECVGGACAVEGSHLDKYLNISSDLASSNFRKKYVSAESEKIEDLIDSSR